MFFITKKRHKEELRKIGLEHSKVLTALHKKHDNEKYLLEKDIREALREFIKIDIIRKPETGDYVVCSDISGHIMWQLSQPARNPLMIKWISESIKEDAINILIRRNH